MTYLVKIKDQIQLTHVPEEGIQHLDEKVYGLEVGELVVVGVDADAEEEARVPPVHDLEVAELDEVGLVLLVAGGDEAVDLCRVEGRVNIKGQMRGIWWRRWRRGRRTSPFSLTFSSSCGRFSSVRGGGRRGEPMMRTDVRCMVRTISRGGFCL